jgi:hypothetical protein
MIIKVKQLFFAAITSFLLVSCTALGFSKTKKNMKLITAYTKTISESEQSNPPMAGYFFVVKWENKNYPETVFWRGDGDWLTCKIEKAHKMMVNGKTTYTSQQFDITTLRKGDTLMLTPVTGGRFPIPAEISDKAKNTLFYKVNGSKWLSLPVSKITKHN